MASLSLNRRTPAFPGDGGKCINSWLLKIPGPCGSPALHRTLVLYPLNPGEPFRRRSGKNTRVGRPEGCECHSMVKRQPWKHKLSISGRLSTLGLQENGQVYSKAAMDQGLRISSLLKCLWLIEWESKGIIVVNCPFSNELIRLQWTLAIQWSHRFC